MVFIHCQCRGTNCKPERELPSCRYNCSESHVAMKLYAKKLVAEIADIESKKYTVAGYPVEFQFKLVPSDMKWLATFAGELSNAAHFFQPLQMSVKLTKMCPKVQLVWVRGLHDNHGTTMRRCLLQPG